MRHHLMIASLFALTAAGCVAGEAGPFEPEEGADDEVSGTSDGPRSTAG